MYYHFQIGVYICETVPFTKRVLDNEYSTFCYIEKIII